MITPAGIKALAPGQTLNDDLVIGLSVRAFPSGDKAFYLRFTTKLGLRRHPKIGDCSILTIADARAAAKSLLLKVANGEDPVGDRNKFKASPTMADLWKKYYALHVKRLKGIRETTRMWDKVIEPRLGRHRVCVVSYEDLVILHNMLRDAPYLANRTLALLSTMFEFAERPLKWRPLNTNPCKGVPRYPELKRNRYAKPPELKAIGECLRAAAASHPQSVAFVYLLLYSGARPAEIGRTQRSWLEPLADGAGVLRLPDSKTGQRDIYLPTQAMDVVNQLPVYPDGTICGIREPKGFWQNLRKRVGCPDLRLYPDLRRSFATVTMSAGVSIDLVGGLLGHKQRQTTLVYAKLMEEAASEASATGAAKMAEFLGADDSLAQKRAREAQALFERNAKIRDGR